MAWRPNNVCLLCPCLSSVCSIPRVVEPLLALWLTMMPRSLRWWRNNAAVLVRTWTGISRCVWIHQTHFTLHGHYNRGQLWTKGSNGSSVCAVASPQQQLKTMNYQIQIKKLQGSILVRGGVAVVAWCREPSEQYRWVALCKIDILSKSEHSLSLNWGKFV